MFGWNGEERGREAESLGRGSSPCKDLDTLKQKQKEKWLECGQAEKGKSCCYDHSVRIWGWDMCEGGWLETEENWVSVVDEGDGIQNSVVSLLITLYTVATRVPPPTQAKDR